MRPPARLATLLSTAFWAIGCGGSGSRLPDYTEFLQAGVDPGAEADALASGLERAGFVIATRVETERWVALEARRGGDEGQRAIRVVTSRGAALVLDSHEPDGLLPRHGRIELLPSPRAPSHDLDGDRRDEVLVGAWHGAQRCVLPFRVAEDGTIAPVPPELDVLGAGACIESFRDVDGDDRLEAIAVVRLPALARAEVPAVEAPLVRGQSGAFRAGPAPVRFVAEERARRERALDVAVRELDREEVYRLALELAALVRIAGSGRDAQLAAFDGAIARIVLDEAMAADVRRAREVIAHGWATTQEDEPRGEE